MPTGVIESLDHEARGITRLDGKTIFVEGALPGERVEYVSFRKKPSFEVARTERILKASPDRVVPRLSLIHISYSSGWGIPKNSILRRGTLIVGEPKRDESDPMAPAVQSLEEGLQKQIAERNARTEQSQKSESTTRKPNETT